MFISAINALTLSPALCGVFLKPHHGPRRGLIGKVMRAIDYVRDLYGAAVARIVRFSIIGLVLVGVAAAGAYGLAGHADRIPARGRPGRLLRGRAAAGRRVGGAYPRTWSRRREASQGGAGGRGCDLGRRAELHRQLFAVQRRLHRRHAQAVRGTQDRGRSAPPRSSPACAGNSAQIQGGIGDAAGAAADHRAGHRRRLHLCAAGPCAAAIRRRSPRRCAGSSSPPTRTRS